MWTFIALAAETVLLIGLGMTVMVQRWNMGDLRKELLMAGLDVLKHCEFIKQQFDEGHIQVKGNEGARESIIHDMHRYKLSERTNLCSKYA